LGPPAEALGVLRVGAVEGVLATYADLDSGAEVDRGRRKAPASRARIHSIT
jgi:hypothetical protein